MPDRHPHSKRGNGEPKDGITFSAADPVDANSAEQRLARAIESWPHAELPDKLKHDIAKLVSKHHKRSA